MIDFGLFKVKKCVQFILRFLANPKDVHFVETRRTSTSLTI